MPEYITLRDAERFINFMLYNFDGEGLAMLLGRSAPPTAVMLHELQTPGGADYGVRISGGEDVPTAQRVLESSDVFFDTVKKLGGWDNITGAFRDFRAAYPETWHLLEMSVLYIRPGGMIRDGLGGMSSMIAKRYDGITAKTQRRRRKKLIRVIANFLITHPSAGDMILYDDPELYRKIN